MTPPPRPRASRSREDLRLERVRLPTPWVSGAILVVSVAVHLLKIYVLSRGVPQTAGQALALELKFGALYAPAVRDGQWWRLFSWVFTHGGIAHLGFNMLAVVGLGFPLERRIGSPRFLQLSLATCLGAAAVVLMVPHGPPLPTLGASGVIFGWAGALLFLVSRAQVRELLKMLLLNAVISMLPGVSWQGHLGGFLFGVACGFLLRVDPQKFSARSPVLVALGGVLSLYGAYHSP